MRLEPLATCRMVGGLDVYYGTEKAWAAVVVMNREDFAVEGSYSIWDPVENGYIPDSFILREGPISLKVLGKLFPAPDVLLVDANGILHPRRCGLASMLGLAYELPTIGVAKKPGRYAWTEPAPERGAWTPITMEGSVLGACLRTRDQKKPVFVSPGHLCDLESAIQVVLSVCQTRLPEPLKRAHQTAGKMHRLLG